MQVKMEPVPSWPAYRTATSTEWLYQKLYSSSWGWAHNCLKHVEDSNKRITEKKNCVSSWLPTRIIWRCTVPKIFNNSVYPLFSTTFTRYTRSQFTSFLLYNPLIRRGFTVYECCRGACLFQHRTYTWGVLVA